MNNQITHTDSNISECTPQEREATMAILINCRAQLKALQAERELEDAKMEKFYGFYASVMQLAGASALVGFLVFMLMLVVKTIQSH